MYFKNEELLVRQKISKSTAFECCIKFYEYLYQGFGVNIKLHKLYLPGKWNFNNMEVDSGQ